MSLSSGGAMTPPGPIRFGEVSLSLGGEGVNLSSNLPHKQSIKMLAE